MTPKDPNPEVSFAEELGSHQPNPKTVTVAHESTPFFVPQVPPESCEPLLRLLSGVQREQPSKVVHHHQPGDEERLPLPAHRADVLLLQVLVCPPGGQR